VLELGFVAALAPVRVVAVLLALFGIAACGLQVAGRGWADPDVFIGGRDGKRFNPCQRRFVGNFFAFWLEIAEAAAFVRFPPNARLLVRDKAEAGGLDFGLDVGGIGTFGGGRVLCHRRHDLLLPRNGK